MNHLSKESSPYLLQHKDNPVHWHAWNQEAWKMAKEENKLVLVSIGYSSCHWCHVMEHEVFEDFECAEFMNQNFVCIKVDREERPDVDNLYMDAIHLMGSKGGWPLNVFTLPDGRPIYGGTYFPKQHWLSVLENLADLFRNDKEKVLSYANRLHQGISQLNLIQPGQDESPFDIEFLDNVILHWSKYWDNELGGAKRSPKFPMPNNLELLLFYGVMRRDKESLDHVQLTLEKMALGGIYDQIGGGFSRYSVDEEWKVPHFEKMLYDNAQLISLYAKAYRYFRNDLFLKTAEQSVEWLKREMLSASHIFYSALDADSEGVEGKFYVWTKDELIKILGDDEELAIAYFSIDQAGLWEHGNNILLRQTNDEKFCETIGMELSILKVSIQRISEKLLIEREKRIRPGLDFKCITSWNALLITGFCEIYRATLNKSYMQLALDTYNNLLNLTYQKNEKLLHIYTKGVASIEGFLDDYASLAQAAIDLYEITFSEEYLDDASAIVELAIKKFFDSENGLFYFSEVGEELISRKQEIQDNVIPASNSMMARALFRLGHHIGKPQWQEISERMLRTVLPRIDYASGYSNWLQLYMELSLPFFEVAISGDNISKEVDELHKSYSPNVVLAASTSQSELPLLKSRRSTQTSIYVCTNNTCLAPTQSVDEVFKMIS